MRRCLATVKSYRAKTNGKNDISQQLITTSITHQQKNQLKSWVSFKILFLDPNTTAILNTY